MAKSNATPTSTAPGKDASAITLGQMLKGDQRLPILGLVGVGLAVMAFFYGVLGYYGLGGNMSTVQWWWSACNAENDYTHGRFVPVAIAGLLYFERKRLLKALVRPQNIGLAVVIVGCLFFILSIRTLQPRIALGAIPFLVLGGSMFAFGWGVTKRLVFPVGLIYFAIPLPGLNQATNKLQIIATQTAYHISSLLGADVVISGNNIESADNSWPGMETTEGATAGFNIAEGCSGIRSLIALTLIAAVYAHLTQKQLWKKIVLFAASIPLALLANGLRVTTIILIAEYWDAKFAGEAYHNYSGFLFFPLGLAGLILMDLALNRRLPFIKKKEDRRTQVQRGPAKQTP